jgi:hypothetical protein
VQVEEAFMSAGGSVKTRGESSKVGLGHHIVQLATRRTDPQMFAIVIATGTLCGWGYSGFSRPGSWAHWQA